MGGMGHIGGMGFARPMGGVGFSRPMGGMAFNRPAGVTALNRPMMTRPMVTRPLSPQAFNRNRVFADRNRDHDFDRRHFRRGAFFAFGAGFPYWDNGYYDSCWAWNGVEWVNVCYPYPYY
jgi:hypothetical protein